MLNAFQKLHYVLRYFCLPNTDLFSKTDKAEQPEPSVQFQKDGSDEDYSQHKSRLKEKCRAKINHLNSFSGEKIPPK